MRASTSVCVCEVGESRITRPSGEEPIKMFGQGEVPLKKKHLPSGYTNFFSTLKNRPIRRRHFVGSLSGTARAFLLMRGVTFETRRRPVARRGAALGIV